MRERIIVSEKYGAKSLILDDDDFEKFKSVKLCFQKNKTNFYVRISSGKLQGKYLHRLITNITSNLDVDHINGNTFDNRKENLRICTRSQNMMNQGKNKSNTSGYKGVTYHKGANKFMVQIAVDGLSIYGGLFVKPEDAVIRYNELSRQYHGEFGYQNEVQACR